MDLQLGPHPLLQPVHPEEDDQVGEAVDLQQAILEVGPDLDEGRQAVPLILEDVGRMIVADLADRVEDVGRLHPRQSTRRR